MSSLIQVGHLVLKALTKGEFSNLIKREAVSCFYTPHVQVRVSHHMYRSGLPDLLFSSSAPLNSGLIVHLSRCPFELHQQEAASCKLTPDLLIGADVS